jgi:CRP/FNR family transcriptional regulator, cyclic AMP receptor protein
MSATDPAGAGRAFAAGDVLFQEGDAGDALFVIQEGSVRLHKEIDGETTVIAELGAGDFLGEVPAVLGKPHTATAVATAPTRCLTVGVGALEAMVVGEAEIAVQLIRGLVARLAASHHLLEMVGQRDARTRVCLAILRHADASSHRTAEGILIERRLADVGEEVAVGKAELGEISKHLLKLQLLRLKRNGILVPDVARLYDFVKSGDG